MLFYGVFCFKEIPILNDFDIFFDEKKGDYDFHHEDSDSVTVINVPD